MVFVAGGTGYTGRFLVEALVREGVPVRCLARETSQTEALERAGAALVRGDLERPAGLGRALEGSEALVSAVHIRYAPALIEACREAGVRRVIFLSSTWRFSKVKTPDVAAVIAGEDAVANSGLDATILRPTMIYGPGDDRNISRLRDYVRRHRVFPVFGSGERLVQPVYVADVVGAVVGVLARSGTVNRVYELGGGRPLFYGQMIDVLCRAVGRAVVKLYLPISVAVPVVALYERLSGAPRIRVDQVRRMGEHRAFDISEAVRDIGFAPRSFEEGLAEAMRCNGEEVFL